MKKHLLMVLSLLTTAGGMLVGGELRSVFVYNQDLKLESKGAPLYWKAFNRDLLKVRFTPTQKRNNMNNQLEVLCHLMFGVLVLTVKKILIEVP